MLKVKKSNTPSYTTGVFFGQRIIEWKFSPGFSTGVSFRTSESSHLKTWHFMQRSRSATRRDALTSFAIVISYSSGQKTVYSAFSKGCTDAHPLCSNKNSVFSAFFQLLLPVHKFQMNVTGEKRWRSCRFDHSHLIAFGQGSGIVSFT